MGHFSQYVVSSASTPSRATTAAPSRQPSRLAGRALSRPSSRSSTVDGSKPVAEPLATVHVAPNTTNTAAHVAVAADAVTVPALPPRRTPSVRVARPNVTDAVDTTSSTAAAVSSFFDDATTSTTTSTTTDLPTRLSTTLATAPIEQQQPAVSTASASVVAASHPTPSSSSWQRSFLSFNRRSSTASSTAPPAPNGSASPPSESDVTTMQSPTSHTTNQQHVASTSSNALPRAVIMANAVRSGPVSLFMPSRNWTPTTAVLDTTHIKFYHRIDVEVPTTEATIPSTTNIARLIGSFEGDNSVGDDHTTNNRVNHHHNTSVAGKPIVVYLLSDFDTIQTPSSFNNVSEIILSGPRAELRFALQSDPERTRWVQSIRSTGDYFMSDSIANLLKRIDLPLTFSLGTDTLTPGNEQQQTPTTVDATTPNDDKPVEPTAEEKEAALAASRAAAEAAQMEKVISEVVGRIISESSEQLIKTINGALSSSVSKTDVADAMAKLRSGIKADTADNVLTISSFSRQWDEYQRRIARAIEEAATNEKFDAEQMQLFMKGYLKEISAVIRTAVDRDDLVSELKTTVTQALCVGNYAEFIESLQIGKSVQTDLISMLRAVNDTMELFKTHFPLLASKSDARTIIDGIEEIKIRMGRNSSSSATNTAAGSTASLFSGAVGSSSSNLALSQRNTRSIDETIFTDKFRDLGKRLDSHWESGQKSLQKIHDYRESLSEQIESVKRSVETMDRQSRDRQSAIVDRLTEMSSTARDQAIKIAGIRSEVATTKELISEDSSRDRLEDMITLLGVMINDDAIGGITRRLDNLESMMRSIKQSERLAQQVSDLELRRDSLKHEIKTLESKLPKTSK